MIGLGLRLGLGRLSVLQGPEGTDDWILSLTQLFCLSDLENLDQSPVLQ